MKIINTFHMSIKISDSESENSEFFGSLESDDEELEPPQNTSEEEELMVPDLVRNA